MILGYGSYRHGLGEAALAITRNTVYSEEKIALGVLKRWAVAGVLQGADAAAISSAIAALEAAYAVEGQDAILFFDDGATRSAHQLLNSAALGGVRVVQPPFFSHGEGAEYTTWRSYSLVIEALLPATDAGTRLCSWEETLTFAGGGARWRYLPTLDGPPIKQIVQAQLPQRVVQAGRAVGYLAYPLAPAPLYPAAIHQEYSSIRYHAPKRVGTG